jgi:hypothetical protein
MVPRVGMFILISPRMARVISNPIAQDMLLMRVEKISGMAKGIYSFHTNGTVPVPESTAVWVNSR